MAVTFEGNKAKVLSSVTNTIDIFVRNEVYPTRTDIVRWTLEAINHLTLEPHDLAEGIKAAGEKMLHFTITERFYEEPVNYVLDVLYREEMFGELYPDIENLVRDVVMAEAEAER